MGNIFTSIEETIGRTPLVRINRLIENLPVELLAKIEFFNPGGSVKDRIGLAIIQAAEEAGVLRPGGTIVESTSGNTGIALAMVGAARGYRVVIAMPSSMSKERRALMRAFGAELVLTDPREGMRGAVQAAEELVRSTPGAILAKQFENPANPKTHHQNTAQEVWQDTDGKVDILVAGFGTGGTVSGVGRFLKEQNPQIQVIGVEPAESPLVSQGQAGPHAIQGIGANFVPENLEREVLDEVLTIPGERAIEVAKLAAAKEGLLVGISSGAALAGALEVAARPENADKRIVTFLPDTGERYLTTLLYQDLMD